MKHLITFASLSLLTFCLQAQTTREAEMLEKMRKAALEKHAKDPSATPKAVSPATLHPTRTPLRVFATFEDMVADKPMEGMDLSAADWHGSKISKEWIFVMENDQPKKIELEDAKFWGLSDGTGNVFRVYKGNTYWCLALGNKCFYQLTVYDLEFMKDWVSDGPTAEIKGGKRLVEDIIEAAGLKQEYKDANPKREMKDTVAGYQRKLWVRMVVFLTRINGDSAVK